MKGQYLAIETMLTFGMGIMLAIGVVSVFGSYKSDVLSQTRDKQAQMITSEVRTAVFTLEQSDSGYIMLDLPKTLGGSSYTLALDNGVKILTYTQNFNQSFDNLKSRYSFSGTTHGGDVKIYKRNNKFILRPD
ncbi:MAG: hypothetical protein ABEJ99_03685 [Candidatus Nanohaloarchaea archaeon]